MVFFSMKKDKLKLILKSKSLSKPEFAHRDLKSSNILVSLSGEGIICDFGLSISSGSNIKNN